VSRVVTAEDREAAALLLEMAAIYPGDPDGTLAREAAELLGEMYTPPVVSITYGDVALPALDRNTVNGDE